MAVTQKQIAERLNISRSWVARALNDYDEVPAELRARVQAMAQEMGYDLSTNQAARSLISKRYGLKIKNGIIAISFPPLSVSPQHLPFYTPFFKGLETEATMLGLDIVIALHTWNGELPRLIRERGVDGVVTVGFLENEVNEIRALGLPVLTYQTSYKNAHGMMVDDREGTRLATRHLLELGHRNIAYLGVQQIWDRRLAGSLRQQGYEAALAEFGIPVRQEWINTDLNIPDTTNYKYCVGCGKCAACSGWRALKSTSQMRPDGRPPFTAVVCHHDAVAMGVIDHAQKDGLDVPTDLSVVGFDDISYLYEFSPQITSVSFSREEMGKSAIRILQEATETAESTEEPVSYQHTVFPVSLAVHESTAPPPNYKAEVDW